MIRNRLLVTAALLAFNLTLPAKAADDVVTFKAQGSFQDAMFDLENSIVNRGYVVESHSYIAKMLQRTAADVGADKQLYLNAEILQFCSAVVSRAAMATDIENVAYCPYGIFAYEAAANPGEVLVGYRKLPPGGGRDDVNALLDEMVREAAGAQ